MAHWQHKIEIKHFFEDETTPELVVKICDELLRQLNPILKKYETSSLSYADEVFYELEPIIDNFDFLKRLASGEIKKEEWKNYSFSGDFEDEFNGYLEMLYDLGDTVIGKPYKKFMWIG